MVDQKVRTMTDNEINAALAEKAMGWRIIERRGRVRLMSPQDIHEYYDDWTDNYVPVDGDKVTYSGPDFLTDPVASQALKEAMLVNGWYGTVWLGIGETSVRFWKNSEIEGNSDDPSELRAIALAACRALGIEGV